MTDSKFQQLASLVKQENSILGFQKYVYQAHENIDELFQIIKKSQVDEIGCRFNIWRMSMGIFDFRADWSQKIQQLQTSRKAYQEKRNDAFGINRDMKGGKEAAISRNPLMKIMSKPKQITMNQDEFLKEEIKKDVDRTYQQMSFFQNQKALKLLTNVLYVWCKKYPEVSYKQGMNQICASLLYVYFQSANFEKNKPEGFSEASEQVQQAYKLFNDLTFAQADIYSVFDKVMVIQKEMYKTEADSNTKGVINPNSKNNTPILLRIIDIKDHKLKMLDLELFRVIKMQDVQTKSFMLRWLRCMHTREFSLFNSFLIWDSIFLDYYESPSCRQKCTFQFMDAMCLAMFIYMRSIVLNRETASEILQTYQKYPSLEKGKYLEELISLAWSICEALRNQEDIKTNWYEESKRSNELHLMEKGNFVQQKRQQEPENRYQPQVKHTQKQLGSPQKIDLKHQKIEEIEKSQPEQSILQKEQISPERKQNILGVEKGQIDINFRIYFESNQWKQMESLLQRSIKLNEDIQSKSLCNKVLRMLEAKIKDGPKKKGSRQP